RREGNVAGQRVAQEQVALLTQELAQREEALRSLIGQDGLRLVLPGRPGAPPRTVTVDGLYGAGRYSLVGPVKENPDAVMKMLVNPRLAKDWEADAAAAFDALAPAARRGLDRDAEIARRAEAMAHDERRM